MASRFLLAKRRTKLRSNWVIRTLRKLKGWSEAELAMRSGIGVAKISRLENGESRISKKSAERLAKAFAISPEIIRASS